MPPFVPPYMSFNKAAQRAGKGVDAPADNDGHTLLQLAIRNNDTAAAERLITKLGANPNQLDGDGHTPLYDALAAGNLQIATLLVDKGATFRMEDDLGRTPLMWAIERGATPPFIEQLRELGLTLDQENKAQRNALHAAAAANNVDVLDYLLRQRLYVDTVDKEGKTPLHIATETSAYDAMTYLMNTGGADALLRTKEIKTSLHIAAAKGDVAAVDVLLARAEVRQTLDDFRTYEKGYTPLLAAVAENRYEVAERLLAVGANANQQDSTERHSLFIAVEKGFPALVDLLIHNGADVEKAPRVLGTSQTMLHLINKNGYKTILMQLYNAGADLNAVDGTGQTALYKAADARDIEKMQALLELGADPNLANKVGRRPIDAAISPVSYTATGVREAMNLLMANGANPNLAPAASQQFSPLHLVAKSDYPDLVKALLSGGAIIDEPDRSTGATAWLTAVGAGKGTIAKILKEAGADVTRRDSSGRNVLHMAAQGGARETLESFLADPDMKAQINTPDAAGLTPLHFAVRNQKLDCVRLLVSSGADALAVDNEGKTPLHYAASAYTDSVFAAYESAVGKDLNVNIQSTVEKETPLHIAAKSGYFSIVERLLKLDADITLKDSLGRSALMLAVAQEQTTSVRALIERMKTKEISLNTERDNSGKGLLHHAVARWTPIMTATLVEAGADVNMRTTEGDTPLHLAAAAGKTDIVRYLILRDADLLATNKLGATPLELAIEANKKEVAELLTKALQAQQAKEQAQQASAQAKPQPPRPPVRPPRP